MPELEGRSDNLNVSSRVQAVLVVSGPVDFLRLYHDALTTPNEMPPKVLAAIKALMGGPIEAHEATAIAASPLQHVSKDDPPFLIIHGEFDRVVPVEHSQRLYEELRKAGVNATLKMPHVGHQAVQMDAVKDAEVFFDATLKKR